MNPLLSLILCYIPVIISLKTGLPVHMRLVSPLIAFSSTKDEGSMVGLSAFSKDAQWLGEQVIKWLDMEWIEQPVHSRIGKACSDLYFNGRQTGIIDLGEMLIEIGTGLESVSFNDPEGDAYVNAWDVANKCSDLLMLRMNSDPCECMGDTSVFKGNMENELNTERVDDLASDLSSTFQRYRWMARFLDDEESYDDTAIVLALVLGFRGAEGRVVFNDTIGAYGWQNECKEALPVYSMLDSLDTAMEARLRRDIPEDPEVTDVAIEPVVGIEMYKKMSNPERGATKWELRRVLLAKWLYVHGFMTSESFPSLHEYVPAKFHE